MAYYMKGCGIVYIIQKTCICCMDKWEYIQLDEWKTTTERGRHTFMHVNKQTSKNSKYLFEKIMEV